MNAYKATRTNDFDFRNHSHPAWQQAIEAELVPNTAGKDIVPRTSFVLLSSDMHLYFKITAEDENPRSTMTGYNQPLYNEEVVELFISWDGRHERYYEYEANHLGAVFSAYIDHSAAGNKINFISAQNNPTETYVSTNSGGFVVSGRVQMPLGDAPPNGKIADGAIFNVYRIKRTDNGDMMLAAFSPTGKDNFHMPEKFAKIEL